MSYKDFLKEYKDLIIAGIFAVIVLCAIFFPQDDNKNQIVGQNISVYQPLLDSVEAKSFYVYDISTNNIIFSKDEHLKLPLASISKLMSGLVVLDVLPETTIITISMNDIMLEGDSGLALGEKWKLKDLLDFSLIESSNDGMHAIASALNNYEFLNNKDTIKMMNEKAVSLGMEDTIFINETGLDVNENMSGAYSSAHDVAVLLTSIIKNNPQLISNTSKTTESFISLSGITHIASNTNISINKIPSLIASKTGFTILAGGNLAIVFDAGIMHPIVVVVLGSTEKGRFDDVVKLSRAALEKLSE